MNLTEHGINQTAITGQTGSHVFFATRVIAAQRSNITSPAATFWLERPPPAMASCRRSDFLLRPFASEHVAAMMSSRDLARLCATSTRHRRAAASLVRMAMRAQHGVDGGSLGDLRLLENIPSACSVDLREPGACTVERGSPFYHIYVGSLPLVVTQAQNPPASGDEWSLSVMLRRGRHSLEVRGWLNPAHGILDMYLDGVRVTPAGGFDWCGPRTARHLFHTAAIDVKWSGEHRLVGRTSRSNAAEPHRSRRYWMCLRSLSVRPSPAMAGEAKTFIYERGGRRHRLDVAGGRVSFDGGRWHAA